MPLLSAALLATRIAARAQGLGIAHNPIFTTPEKASTHVEVAIMSDASLMAELREAHNSSVLGQIEVSNRYA